ncbi:MAG: hypothetical protein K0B37_16100 [Bacteroidales bacterium]|nr:hypothetical protein [Bacteroidales bacterium]
MKNIFLLFIALISFTVVFAQKTELKYNLETGREYIQEMTTESKIQQHIMGMDMEINNTMVMEVGYKVVNQDGRYYDMEVRYISMLMDMETPYGRNSLNSETADANDPGSMMLARITNIPFEMRMRDDGKVTEIKNMDAIFNSLMEGMGDINNPEMMQLNAQLQQQFSEQALKSQVESFAKIYPDKPVAVGDQWESTMEMVSMMPMNVKNVYQFMGEKDGFYHIQGISEINSTDMPADASGMNMTMDMAGNQSFSFLIDKTTGWISEAAIIQDIGGDITAQNPMDGESFSFTMNMSSIVTIKGR